MKTNLHSHTQFCDSHSSMEQIVKAAREAGFACWGFSPHGPICLESPCNMKKESIKEYIAEIKRLRELFPDMKILAGMEVDYINKENGPASPEVKEYGLDYMIGSVHFIPNQKGNFYDIDGSPERFKKTLQDFFDNDLDYVVKTFWTQTQNMIEAGGLDIVGHIDKIALNASSVDPEIENTPEYLSMAEKTIGMAIEKGLAIEINTKHFQKYGRFFPHPRFWKKILDSGINTPVNSDTHYADRVADGMQEAFNLLKQFKNGNQEMGYS